MNRGLRQNIPVPLFAGSRVKPGMIPIERIGTESRTKRDSARADAVGPYTNAAMGLVETGEVGYANLSSDGDDAPAGTRNEKPFEGKE